MKKIISLFKRDYGSKFAINQTTQGAEWVINGEGVATRKFDGTCCMVRNGRLYKRYEVKSGKILPPDFEPAEEVDKNTGKQPGWRPVGTGPEDAYHREAFTGTEPDGTYELIGPKIQGNPEKWPNRVLIPHGKNEIHAPRTFSELREWFLGAGNVFEGVVWWHPDGRMVKIKAKDFGVNRENRNSHYGVENENKRINLE